MEILSLVGQAPVLCCSSLSVLLQHHLVIPYWEKNQNKTSTKIPEVFCVQAFAAENTTFYFFEYHLTWLLH